MKKYILYGAGWQAEKFLYNFKEREAVSYCIDGYRTGTFHGLPIYTLSNAPDINKHKVIVTALWEKYVQI